MKEHTHTNTSNHAIHLLYPFKRNIEVGENFVTVISNDVDIVKVEKILKEFTWKVFSQTALQRK
jgi:hypothetical protein